MCPWIRPAPGFCRKNLPGEAEPGIAVAKIVYRDRPEFERGAVVPCRARDPVWMAGKSRPERAARNLDPPAFVVDSSGATAEAKGIQNPHRGAVRSCRRRCEFSDYRVGDRAVCHIFFFREVPRPLLWGGAFWIVPCSSICDPKPLIRFPAKNKIAETLPTPPLPETVLDILPFEMLQAPPARLQVLRLDGEGVVRTLRDRAPALPPKHTRMLNTCGISKCRDVASLDLRHMAEAGSVFCPVGAVNRDVDACLLGDRRLPVSGEPGELPTGGPCLAGGCHKNPALTACRIGIIDGERPL